MAAYQQAMANPVPIGISRSKQGSVAAAVAAYLVSPEFSALASGTQVMRRSILQRFRDQYGAHPIGMLPPKFIALVLSKKSPHAARSLFKTLRALCQFALAAEMIPADPTAGMKLPKVKKSAGHHTWIAAEVEQYEAAHPIGTKARLALALGIFTLQRRSDVIRMGRQHIRGGLLYVRQQKTGAELAIPLHPDLQAVLDSTPSEHLTFLVTRRGQPYSGSEFSEAFRAWCDEAGLPKRCTFHGLRKAGCTVLADCGCSAHEIAAKRDT
jgi:integrase